MREVSLIEILDARERRVAAQQKLLAQYKKPLVGLNMNIAGPVKRSGLSDLAFRAAMDALRAKLGGALLHMELTDAPTGLEAILVCDLPARELKALAMTLETAQPVGRLYDLDVIDVDGNKLSRPTPRTCLVCGGPVGPCARSRAHGLDAIQAATEKLLQDFAAVHLADLAVGTLIDEVDLTPKPGLVDRRNTGAHTDMDLPMFHRSARALRPYFQTAAALGMESDDCMKSLQQAGLLAEETMLTATGGVNTHKGAVYAVGILLAALGGVLVRGGDVFARCAALAKAGLPPTKNTHGSLVKARYGASGARGEALAGFPQARMAQRALRRHKGDAIPALLTLLSQVEDTNLLHRGGTEGLHLVQREAAAILAGPADRYADQMQVLDDLCIAKNLSPGGSADLLALALLLDRTREIWETDM